MRRRAVTIHHFAVAQTDVFVPALAVLAVAALFGVLPVIFAPTLRRRRAGRLMTAACVVVAAAVLVLTAVQAGTGFRVLGDERARVQRAVSEQYGLTLTSSEVGVLVDGGGIERPAEGYGKKGVRFRLTENTTDDYVLVYGKGRTAVPLPTRS